MEFCYKNTTEVIFSKNVVSEIELYTSKLKVKKIYVISGLEYSASIAKSIVAELSLMYNVLLFSGVQTNPTEDIINKAVITASSFFPDLIITVGGGSSHDCGKAVSVLLKNTKSNCLNDYTTTGSINSSGIISALPIITVPTIVGSGAEVSPAALVRINNEKKIVFSPLIHPVATIINSSYMMDISVHTLARSSFDSLIHSLEGYLSEFANPISDSFALSSIVNYMDCLQFVLNNSISEEIVNKLAVASFLSSYVCSVSGVGAIHALSNPISGRYNIHHADALAMVAPEVLKYNLRATNANLDKIANVLGIQYSEKDDLINSIINWMKDLIDSLSIGKQKLALGSNKETIYKMVKECDNSDMAGNPYLLSDKDILSIYHNSLMSS